LEKDGEHNCSKGSIAALLSQLFWKVALAFASQYLGDLALVGRRRREKKRGPSSSHGLVLHPQ
jgi:hypothetical protein